MISLCLLRFTTSNYLPFFLLRFHRSLLRLFTLRSSIDVHFRPSFPATLSFDNHLSPFFFPFFYSSCVSIDSSSISRFHSTFIYWSISLVVSFDNWLHCLIFTIHAESSVGFSQVSYSPFVNVLRPAIDFATPTPLFDLHRFTLNPLLVPHESPLQSCPFNWIIYTSSCPCALKIWSFHPRWSLH